MERAARRADGRDPTWSQRFTKLFSREKPASDEMLAGRDRSPLRETASDPRRVHSEAFFLAIASGKGGTGKSFLATNLAVSLCGRGRDVTLVDCDFGMANDHLLLGVNPSRSIQHFFAGEVPLDEVKVRTPFGPSLLPGGSGISRLGDLTEGELLKLGDGLASIGSSTDVVLMDAAAGISPQSILTLLAAHHVLLVTNPEIAALTDAYALIKCLSSHPQRPQISVVVNRVGSQAQGQATFQKLADVSRRFSRCEIHYLGAIPEEPAVTHHRLNQPPLVVSHPTCQASKAIFTIQAQLDQLVGPVGQRPVAAGESVAQRFRRNMIRRQLRQ